MLDPGHGAKDPGAIGNGLQEKNLTLAIAKFCANHLNSAYEGAEVELTREDDRFLELSERAQKANNARAELFVSIHINSSAGAIGGGFESYRYNGTTSPATIAAQNQIHAAIMGSGIFDRDRGKKTANFAVLRETAMIAVLTENGFINNPQDAAILRQDANLQRIGIAHAQGIAQFLGLKAKSQPPADTAQKLFKVQVGAFAERSGAETLAKELQAKGYKTYITEE